MTESLMRNHGLPRGNSVIEFVPEASVLKLNIGARIRINAAGFNQKPNTDDVRLGAWVGG